MAKLTQTISANGAGTTWEPAAGSSTAIECNLTMTGSFGGGSITWQMRNSGDPDWTPANGMLFTAAEGGPFIASPGVEYRPNMAGATAPSVLVSLVRPGDVQS
jgi:hypothetical protein